MEIAIVPVFLGSGSRLFENLEDAAGLKIKQVRVIDAPGVAHLKYDVER